MKSYADEPHIQTLFKRMEGFSGTYTDVSLVISPSGTYSLNFDETYYELPLNYWLLKPRPSAMER